jgi:NitT/TauT family transport system substrate-binding protein
VLRRLLPVALALAVPLAAVGCGDDDSSSAAPTTSAGTASTVPTSNGTAASTTTATTTAATTAGSSTTAAPARAPITLRLGYFPNVTHASAIVGVEKGIFAAKLGTDKLDVKTFNAGPAAVEALFSGAIDAAYLGPNPAINAYQKSDGKAIRIISGATSGGASLVVKPGINAAADLKGKKVASPQLGGTQDVALRKWLKDNGLKTDPNGGGDVSILPQDNAQTLDTFKSGAIDGAWVPEPWATRLVTEGGGKVLVDERTLWPGGQFVTTHLIVSTDFLTKHPDVVQHLVEGQVAANDLIAQDPAGAQKAVNDGITKITGKGLSADLIAASFKNMTFTNDPIASSLAVSAKNAQDIGLLQPVDLTNIYDLSILNAVLKAAGKPEVKGL